MIFFLILLGWSLVQPSRVQRCVKKSINTQDISPITEELQKRPEELQPLFFRKSMNLLWLSSSPESQILLQNLCLFFVKNHPQKTAGHQWISKIQQERPTILNEALLQNYNCDYINKREPG